MMNATADRLLNLAESHMRNAGYGVFRSRELAVEVGITSASVHHYFQSQHSGGCGKALRDRFFVAVDRRPGNLLRTIAQLRARKTRHENELDRSVPQPNQRGGCHG